MKIWTDREYPIIISVAKHLAPAVAGEVEGFGYDVVDEADNTVVVKGNMRDVFFLNLHLRCAHRVLVPLLRGRCRHIRELYEKVRSIDWENLIEADGYFSVSSVVHTRSIRDTRMPALVTKDAIVDRIRDICGRRPDSGPENTGAAVFVHWHEERVIVYLDTSGQPLSKRGYRKIPGSAPMQETLAAACIQAMRWDMRVPFVAPMCGSGTPAIEAALMAINRAPGALRSHFAFMSIKGYKEMIAGESAPRSAPRQYFGATPEQIYKDMLLEAEEKEIHEDLPQIIATDISPEAVQNAQLNANAAGVAKYITFKACDFADTPVPEVEVEGDEAKGCVFFNPEYGIRLGDPQELEETYARIGKFMAEKCRGWTGGLFSGNRKLAGCVDLYYATRIPFYNGPIECRLVIYPGCREVREEREEGAEE